MQRRTDESRLPSELPSDRHLPVDVDVPLVIDAETTVWRGSLLLLALCAYLKTSVLHIFSILGWALRGQWHLERKLVEARISPNVFLPLDPRVAAIAERAANQGRSVYLAVPARAPLLREVGPRHPAIAEVIVAGARTNGSAKPALTDLSGRFPMGYDFLTHWHGLDVTRNPPAGGIGSGPGSSGPLAGRFGLGPGSRSIARAGTWLAASPVRQEPHHFRAGHPRRPPLRCGRGDQHRRRVHRSHFHCVWNLPGQRHLGYCRGPQALVQAV